MVGYFGNIVFETSDKRMLSFNGFKRDVKSRWGKHDVIGVKPISEFLGPDLDGITFTVTLNGSYGVKPRNEMERWNSYVNNGNAEILVIGGKPLGADKWTVQSVSDSWDTIFNKGELYSGKIDVTLQEYVEDLV